MLVNPSSCGNVVTFSFKKEEQMKQFQEILRTS